MHRVSPRLVSEAVWCDLRNMSTRRAEHPRDRETVDPARFLKENVALVDSLYAQSSASRWGLSQEQFHAALTRSVCKHYTCGTFLRAQLEEYLAALHLEDLTLAAACVSGCEAAWEYFVAAYRGYLRAAAAAVLRRRADSPEVHELADSLFAELYGLDDRKTGERSLFRYFHGRSSLKTWLRAVIAQRHIDAVRAGRRFASLDEGETGRERFEPGRAMSLESPADPHRERYSRIFRRVLDVALARLDPRDSERLRLYYAEEKTLADVGRQFGEHESSVSRNLERIRRDLRRAVEEMLRAGHAPANGFAGEPGLSDAEIVLCFEYAAEEAPIDLDSSLPRRTRQDPTAGRQKQ
jgi:RNA polymerase sigma-70 factor, ECF subfamily